MGANSTHLSHQHCKHALVVMALICLALYRAFRRSGWL
jgi:Mg2+ and Co2+ transporter CorA